MLAGGDAKLAEGTEELVLGHVLVPCDVEVLELRLQVNSFDHYGLSVLAQDGPDGCLLFVSEVEVLSSGRNRVINRHGSHGGQRVFLNTVGGEGSIDIGAKTLVVDHVFSIVCRPVLRGKRTVFFGGQVEIKHGENFLELRFRDLASSELVEVEEELLNSHSFHHNLGLEPLLDVVRVVPNLNPFLQESVIDHIQAVGGRRVIRAACVSELAQLHGNVWLWIFGSVLGEDVFWAINVRAEFEVIDFSNIALIEILAQQKLKQGLRWRNELKLFKHSPELLSSNMAALGPVVVLELGLYEDSLECNLRAHGSQEGKKGVFLGVSKIGSALGVLDDGDGVRAGGEDDVYVAAEVRVVDEAGSHPVLFEELLDLLLVHPHVKRAEAGAELY